MTPRSHNILALLLALSATTLPSWSDPQAEQTITPGTAANTWDIDWDGVAGRTYFVQCSLDLVTWHYAPYMEFGAGAKTSAVECRDPTGRTLNR